MRGVKKWTNDELTGEQSGEKKEERIKKETRSEPPTQLPWTIWLPSTTCRNPLAHRVKIYIYIYIYHIDISYLLSSSWRSGRLYTSSIMSPQSDTNESIRYEVGIPLSPFILCAYTHTHTYMGYRKIEELEIPAGKHLS